jgi:hypothetical protein
MCWWFVPKHANQPATRIILGSMDAPDVKSNKAC